MNACTGLLRSTRPPPHACLTYVPDTDGHSKQARQAQLLGHAGAEGCAHLQQRQVVQHRCMAVRQGHAVRVLAALQCTAPEARGLEVGRDAGLKAVHPLHWPAVDATHT